MKITVTQADIDQATENGGRTGTFNDKFLDPITLSIKRTLEAQRVMTHPYFAEVDGVWYELSQEAIDFVKKWPTEGGKPFSFTIRAKTATG